MKTRRANLSLAWSSAPAPPTARHLGFYRRGRETNCPGCDRRAWLVGRRYAECGFCGFAMPIAGESQSH